MTKDEALDVVSFSLEKRTCASPNEFDERFAPREKWFQKDTRNHSSYKGGIQREIRQKGEWWYIDDHHNAALTPLLTGRVIVSVNREPDSGEDWGHGENTVVITLDDGSRLRFDGYGYDASGLSTEYSPPQTSR